MGLELIRRSNMRMMAVDSSRIRRSITTPQRNFLCYGTVGHEDPILGTPEPNPAFVRIEQSQVYVEVTLRPDGDQIVARYGMDGAGEGVGEYAALSFGCRVVVELIRGNPQNAVVRSTLNDANCSFPEDVAGVQTGAVGAVAPGSRVPAPLWRFIKLAAGQLLAIETQTGGDILIHSAGVSHLKATTHHLEGRVALGEVPITPPVGQTVGPAGTVVAGVPAVPAVPTPATPGTPAPPATIVPYAGFEDGIIRAKDDVQSHAAKDPAYWVWIAAVGAHPLIAAVAGAPPTAMHSEHGGLNGPGSQHTASD